MQITLDNLYRKAAPVIYGRCRMLLANEEDARDAVHDIFLVLQRKLHTFRGNSEIMTWIYRITTNHCLNRLRSRRIHDSAVAHLTIPPTRRMSQEVSAQAERRQLIARLAQDMKPRLLQMVIHHFVDGMTQEEVARVMGVTDRAVRKALAKFQREAAQTLEVFDTLGRMAP